MEGLKHGREKQTEQTNEDVKQPADRVGRLDDPETSSQQTVIDAVHDRNSDQKERTCSW